MHEQSPKSTGAMSILYVHPTEPNTRSRWANLLVTSRKFRVKADQHILWHFNFSFCKAVRAYSVVLHVYEQFEIYHMLNKTCMSFIQIVSTAFDKKYPRATCNEAHICLRSLVRICAVEAGQSQNKFGCVYFTRFHDVYGAEETHFKFW